MEKFELKVNEEALARRAKRKPSPKPNQIKTVPAYCKGCSLCVDICPTGTLLLEDNAENKFGVSIKVDAQEYCIGCKMCEDRCPDFAIFVNYDANENVNDEEGKQ
ncbi:MAG: 4Fe-4S dicluster domain-containing protein [Acidobacteria bacterium]|jgi:2-oxoglutarate ferredoxin oxidoreductase subunit delta|nr:4Fe-4S dicluster domain-containing protein [Acidobacteriota bacterium]